MGEINRLQIESREVGRGRTILGTAGIAAREELESTRRVNQNALVAGGLAVKAIEENRASVVEATEVLKSVDEEFGKARRATEAIKTVQTATFKIQDRVDDLLQDPNIDPLNLPSIVDREVMAIRNEAVTTGGQLGQELQAYVINKLGGVRNRQVSRARTSGYQREIQEKKGEYFAAAHELTKRMYAPGTSEADRQELFNDLMVLTESMTFYFGEEAVAKLKVESIKGLEKQQFTHLYMINPQEAIERQDELLPNLNPTERAELIGRAERQITLEHQEERQRRQDDRNRIIDKNNLAYDEAIAAENAGESRASVLKGLKSAQIHDSELTAAFERYEQRDRTLTGFAKRQAAPVPSDPRAFSRMRTRIMGGEFRTLQELDEALERTASGHTAANPTIGYQDLPALQTLWSQVDRGETARITPQINQAANTLERMMRDIGVRQILNADQTRKIPSVPDQTRVAELSDQFITLMRQKEEAGTLRAMRTEQLEFLRENMSQFLPGLIGKTYEELTGYVNLTEALAASDDPDFVNRMIITDQLLTEARATKVQQDKAALEGEVAANQLRAQEARQAEVAVIGEAAMRTREADLEKARLHDERKRGFRDALLKLAGRPEPEGPRFRMIDGEFVEVDEEDIPIPFGLTPTGQVVFGKRPFPVFRYIDGRPTDVSEIATPDEEFEILVQDRYDILNRGKALNLSGEDVRRKKEQIRRELQSELDLFKLGEQLKPHAAIVKKIQDPVLEQLQRQRDEAARRRESAESQRVLRESEEKLRLLKEQLGQAGEVPE